jgi:hypothetical protein
VGGRECVERALGIGMQRERRKYLDPDSEWMERVERRRRHVLANSGQTALQASDTTLAPTTTISTLEVP